VALHTAFAAVVANLGSPSAALKLTKERGGARFACVLLALVAVAQLGACAHVPRERSGEVYDPLEPMNRAIFNVNMAVDRAFIKPVAQGYRAVLPEFVRDRFHSFVENLLEPRVFVNNLLQMRLNAAGMTFTRFLMNTTAGVAGLFDPASRFGLPRQSGDFGQTLYMWGLGSGPYLVLPFFGPSNLRDGVGLGVDLVTETNLNPLNAAVTDNRATVNFALGFVYGVDLRARNIETLDAIEANSIDFYSTLRSVSQQHREAELRKTKGLEPEVEPLEDPEAPEK